MKYTVVKHHKRDYYYFEVVPCDADRADALSLKEAKLKAINAYNQEINIYLGIIVKLREHRDEVDEL